MSGFRAETANPARWKGYLDKKFKPASTVKPVRHQTALPDVDMPAFMVDLRGRGGVAALALEFTILTAVRSRDALRARKADIDRTTRVWTIPVFSKTGAVHKVPLSDAAIACLHKAAAIADGMGGRGRGDRVRFLQRVDGRGAAPSTPCSTCSRGWAVNPT